MGDGTQGQLNHGRGAWDQAQNEGSGHHANPKTDFLGLPLELRQRILEYALTVAWPGTFPPAKSRTSSSWSAMAGANGDSTSARTASCPGYLTALFLSRQIHAEARVLPFQINLVACPATFGSNITTTSRFLNRLRAFQRDAIRSLELRLLASETEASSLKSILKLVANVDGKDQHQELPDTDARMNSGHDSGNAGASDLRALTIFIGTRDLYLPQADSLVGLVHMLNPKADAPAPLSCESWITDGLMHLKTLTIVTIAVEMSETVAQRLTASEKDRFQQVLFDSLPSTCEIKVYWKVVDDLLAKIDDNDWVNFLWSDEHAATAFAHGVA